MTPADIRTHGALGACELDLKATQTELAELKNALADTVASLIASVLATVAATQERDRLRRRLAAVRALCDELETFTGRLSVVQAAASIRAALEPTEGEAP